MKFLVIAHPPPHCSPLYNPSSPSPTQHRQEMAACIDRALTSEAATNPFSVNSEPRQTHPSLSPCRLQQLCRPGNTSTTFTPYNGKLEEDLWIKIRDEARTDAEQEPLLMKYYYSSILIHNSLESALANYLAIKLCNSNLPCSTLFECFCDTFSEDQEIRRAIRDDFNAVRERDPACISFVHCLLHFKGFQACQAHRAAHKLWVQGRRVLALVIQSRVSEVFGVDIHPGARLGRGILLDHATGIVVGETAVVGDNVSILHGVTLGGTGKVAGDRHPKIGNGVLIGAGAKILGNIVIGQGAKIGAGAVVLKEVPPMAIAVGNPARLVAGKERSVL